MIDRLRSGSRLSRFCASIFLYCSAAIVIGGCSGEVEYYQADTELSEPAANVSSTAVAFDAMVLDAMPEGKPATPTEIKESGEQPIAGIVAGRIDAGEIDPFQAGKLAFLISELPDESHAPDDPEHADNCPFCKRKLQNAPKAIVEFRDSDGSVLDGNARSELGLEQGDVVYVSGTAQYNSAVNTVMVDAIGVYRASGK